VSYKELQAQLASAVRNPAETSIYDDRSERLAVYRRLVFNNFYGLLSNTFCDLCEAVTPDVFRSLVRQFIQSKVSATPYFSEISAEFSDWLQTADVKPWIKEFAYYERAGVAMDIADSETPPYLAEFDERSELVFSPALALIDLQYRVFDCPPGETPREEACWVLLYRNPHNKLRYKELNALSFVLLGYLVAGASLNVAMEQLLSQVKLDAQLLRNNSLELLLNLQREGALLGASVE